jgi:hypothetical protein
MRQEAALARHRQRHDGRGGPCIHTGTEAAGSKEGRREGGRKGGREGSRSGEET